MPLIISENYKSRGFQLGDSWTWELLYDVQGSDDDAAVYTLILATAPLSYLGLRRRSVQADPLGGGVWTARVGYEGSANLNELAFDTTGGTAHITQAISTVGRYAPPYQTAPDFQGAIGVSEDRVEGTDIGVGSLSWQVTHQFAFATEDDLWAAIFRWRALTYRFNDAPFKGHNAGECLFRGAVGSGSDLSAYPVTFHFATEPNEDNLAVGGEAEPYSDGYIDEGYYYGDDGVITGISKLGWDYLWTRYADFEDADAKALVKRPVSVHVERVYRPADFSLLGIGV